MLYARNYMKVPGFRWSTVVDIGSGHGRSAGEPQQIPINHFCILADWKGRDGEIRSQF